MVGAAAQGGNKLPCILTSSGESTMPCARGDRGVTRGERGEANVSTSSVTSPEAGRPEDEGSLNTRVDGEGDRFANGSSSSRSEGGEFLGVLLCTEAAVSDTIGITGGSTSSEEVAAVD